MDDENEGVWIERSRANAQAYADSETSFFAELDRRLARMTDSERDQWCRDVGLDH